MNIKFGKINKGIYYDSWSTLARFGLDLYQDQVEIKCRRRLDTHFESFKKLGAELVMIKRKFF